MVCYSAPPDYSGAGAQAVQLAKALRRRGVTVSILASRHRADQPAHGSVEGVPVRRLPVVRVGRLRPLSFSLAAAWHVLRYSGRYDIIHLHGAYWRLLPVLISARLLKRKSVVKMTQFGTDDPQTIGRRSGGGILLRTLGLADAVISTSRQLTESYCQSTLPADRLVVIPNGVDVERYCPATPDIRNRLRIRLDLPLDAPIVIFVGQVGHRKGADLLLRAWAEVTQRLESVRLVLVGPIGEDLPLPQDAVPVEHWLSQARQVIILGQRGDVQDCLRASDVFALPSRMEGLPNALIEAMATGLACVASDIGGNVDLITNEVDGLLVAAGSVEQLVGALMRLLQSDGQRQQYGENARKTVQDRFALSDTADRYLELYRRLAEVPS